MIFSTIVFLISYFLSLISYFLSIFIVLSTLSRFEYFVPLIQSKLSKQRSVSAFSPGETIKKKMKMTQKQRCGSAINNVWWGHYRWSWIRKAFKDDISKLKTTILPFLPSLPLLSWPLSTQTDGITIHNATVNQRHHQFYFQRQDEAMERPRLHWFCWNMKMIDIAFGQKQISG